MNYEALYQEYSKLAKELKDKTALVQRLGKALNKEMETGDLRSFDKDSALLQEAIAGERSVAEQMLQLVSSFDRATYFGGGEFVSQMLDACAEQRIDVRGEFPVYEMFPYKVRLDAENMDIYIDRKKLHCLRPNSFAEKMKLSQTKLSKASFNAAAFLNELAEAYDLALLKFNKNPETDLYLLKLYKLLAPMSRSRKEYDQQSYAYDIARLYASEVETTKDGRRFQFGPARNNTQAIRILDANGREQFLATIKFFHD